jgi:hypothetical protein
MKFNPGAMVDATIRRSRLHSTVLDIAFAPAIRTGPPAFSPGLLIGKGVTKEEAWPST